MASQAQVVEVIKELTQKSQALQGPAQSIDNMNGHLVMIGQGPYPGIINGLDDIVKTTTTALQSMRGMPPVAAGDDSNAIVQAYREFVRINQVLLNILIGKAGLFQSMPPIGQPVAAVLRQVEAAYDTLVFFALDLVAHSTADLTSQAQALSQTLDKAIKSHQN